MVSDAKQERKTKRFDWLTHQEVGSKERRQRPLAGRPSQHGIQLIR
jgi:hypothetical protein